MSKSSIEKGQGDISIHLKLHRHGWSKLEAWDCRSVWEKKLASFLLLAPEKYLRKNDKRWGYNHYHMIIIISFVLYTHISIYTYDLYYMCVMLFIIHIITHNYTYVLYIYIYNIIYLYICVCVHSLHVMMGRPLSWFLAPPARPAAPGSSLGRDDA